MDTLPPVSHNLSSLPHSAEQQPDYLGPTVPPTSHGGTLYNEIAFAYAQAIFSHFLQTRNSVSCLEISLHLQITYAHVN